MFLRLLATPAPLRTAGKTRCSILMLVCFALALCAGGGVVNAQRCAVPEKPAVETECQRNLREKNAEVQALLSKFTELHPDVRALRRTIADIGQCEATPAASVAADEQCGPDVGPNSQQRPADMAPAAPRKAANPAAKVTIDTARTQQQYFGFGSTYALGVLANNRMTDDQWRRAVSGLAKEIGAATGTAPPVIEYTTLKPLVPGIRFSRPIDFTGAQTLFGLFNRFSPDGVADIVPFANINTRWQHQWLNSVKTSDYPRYLDEVAGKAVATVADWEKRNGREPEYLQLWNEPLSGNGELVGGTVQDLVAIIKHTGKRLREAGYLRVRLLVPNEETVGRTLDDMRVIARDPEALSYVGAIGYHAYPYASDYSYIPRLLSIRTQGVRPDATVRERLELRALSRRLGIPVWMTEVSSGYSPGGPRAPIESYVPDSIDWVIGRSIHIHDEFRYAGASAFFGMLALWTDAEDRDHFASIGGSRNLRGGGDNLILVDTAADQVIITGMGRAIGHYGRWLRRGARYIEAESSSPFVLVSPFLDRERLVAVLVNTASTASRITVELEGSAFSGSLTGEQSRTDAQWQPIPSFETNGSTLTLDVPGWSVTTIAVPIR